MKHTKHIINTLTSFLFLIGYNTNAVSSSDFHTGEVDLITIGSVDATRRLSSKRTSSKKSSSGSHGKGKGHRHRHHRHCVMQGDFDVDGVTGYIKAYYVGEQTVDFDVSIDLRNFQPDNNDFISDGSQLAWHLHADWRNNHMYSGANTQCASSLTGGHYDPTVACAPVSEWINSNGYCYGPQGQIVNSASYSCTPTSYWPDSCERGDISGRLGPLTVETQSNGHNEIHFQGRDTFFATETEACEEGHYWNFLIHSPTTFDRILCARVYMSC